MSLDTFVVLANQYNLPSASYTTTWGSSTLMTRQC
jgi:hypothetical protein